MGSHGSRRPARSNWDRGTRGQNRGIGKAAKKASNNIESLKLFGGRTLKVKLSGLFGGSRLVLSQAPEGVGVISTSAMARKMLELSVIRDCYLERLKKLQVVFKYHSFPFKPQKNYTAKVFKI